MSGGVDSSVAAALLCAGGFDVTGVFMKFWKDGQAGKNRCCSAESEKLARLTAKKIGIPFYVVNAEKEFKKKVVDYFLNEYKKGRTPNPCVVCNKEIKFGFLLEKAFSLGADYIATGHYANIKDGRLLKGKDKQKDQSYFLCQLDQKQISRILFPVGNYTKPQVRALAKKFGLPSAKTEESQEICFVQHATNDFLKKYLKTKPGKITDKAGKILGRHNGLWFYTIGQRRGLGVNQGPYFVVSKDFKKNILAVSKNKKDLLSREFTAEKVNWVFGREPKTPAKAEVKIRYRHKPAKAVIAKIQKGKYKISFEKPQLAVTPGQSAVFYRGKELLGGGAIA